MQEDDSSSLIVEAAISIVSTPSPSLPSPLLCPSRTFLAALILASKFSQDKCYSNRAWAKLSDLPPREIWRCERALGRALDWHLWVGKSAVASQSPTLAASISTRTVGRSQSEGPSHRLRHLVPSSCFPPLLPLYPLRRRQRHPRLRLISSLRQVVLARDSAGVQHCQ